MKKSIFALAFILPLIFSCKKEGCTDTVALNYDKEARKDDGNCKYYNSVAITNVSCEEFSYQKVDGSSWDQADNPDTYLIIKDDDDNIIFESDVYENNDKGYHLTTLDQDINVINLDQDFTIYLYDKDNSFDELMGLSIFSPIDYTQNGYKSLKFPTYFTINNEEVSFQLSLEWFE